MRPILVTGASGKLGAYVVRHLVRHRRRVVAWSGTTEGEICGVELRPVELTDSDAVRRAYGEADPAATIHCAALSAIGDCYRMPGLAQKINVQATELLADLSDRLVYTSTDLVFDGLSAPYSEEDPAKPLSVYGQSKLAGEAALKQKSGATVVRVSLMYGPGLLGPGGFFEQQYRALQAGETLRLFSDEWRTPLALQDAAKGLVQVLDSDFRGILHLGGPDRISRAEMGHRLAKALKADESLVQTISQSSIDFPEPRPTDVSLDSGRARELFGWDPSPFALDLAPDVS